MPTFRLYGRWRYGSRINHFPFYIPANQAGKQPQLFGTISHIKLGLFAVFKGNAALFGEMHTCKQIPYKQILCMVKYFISPAKFCPGNWGLPLQLSVGVFGWFCLFLARFHFLSALGWVKGKKIQFPPKLQSVSHHAFHKQRLQISVVCWNTSNYLQLSLQQRRFTHSFILL